MTEPIQFADVDLARLAAFIDGEGCISIKVNANVRWAHGKQLCLRLQLANTDVRLVAWLKGTFKVGSVHTQKRPKGHKPLHYWEVTGRKLCDLLHACCPYLIIKREQAETAFAFQDLIGRGYGGPNNPLSENNMRLREELKARLHQIKKEVM